jgi:hypothetical protein
MKKWIKRVGISLCLCTGIIFTTIVILMVMAAKFNGIWKMEAYGLCLNADQGMVKAYVVTEKSYTRMSNYDGVIVNGTLYCGIGKFKLDKSKNTLKLTDNGSRYVYSADKQTKDIFISYIRSYKEIKSVNYVCIMKY